MGSRVIGAKSAAVIILLALAAHPAGPGRTATAWSAVPPDVIVDVSRSLGITPSSATLDSIHFPHPMLLLGTDTNSTGRSFAFIVNPTDLTIVDTLISLRSKVKVVVAGLVDSDSLLDYLVGVDSSVTLILGTPAATPETYRMHVTFPLRPWDSLSSTATTTGLISDVAIDDRSGAFWIAYITDVTYYPYPMDEYRESKGGLRYYATPTGEGVDLIRSASVVDLVLIADSSTEKPALLAFSYSIYEVEIHFVANEPRSRSFGYQVFGDFPTGAQLAGVSNPGGAVSLSAKTPDHIADFAGTGLQGFVYSWASSTWGPGNPGMNKQETAVWMLASRSKLWSLPNYGTSRVWELDGDGAADVLLFGASQTVGLKGTTGEELFSVSRSELPFPVVSGTLLEDGVQHGVTFVGDTLQVFHLVLKPTGVQSPVLPEGFELVNAPNPFNTSTVILYSLSSAATTRLLIYDVLGKRVRLLKDGYEQAGQYGVTWNGIDDRGQPVGSGVYFYQLVVDETAVSRKMLLLK